MNQTHLQVITESEMTLFSQLTPIYSNFMEIDTTPSVVEIFDPNAWKQDVAFLRDYGYNMDELKPSTRISIQTDTSLTTIGGRSAPTANRLIEYLHKHPTYQVVHRYTMEELSNLGFWCKYCGYISNELTVHQMNCLYRTEVINTMSDPSDVYSFLDTVTTGGTDYESGDVNEWFSFFGPLPGIMDNPFQRDEEIIIPQLSSPQTEPDLRSILQTLLSENDTMKYFITDEAMLTLRTCLDVYFDSLLDDCNRESVKRTKCEDSNGRILVPPLLNSVNETNLYLQFVTNTGLQKPNITL